MPPRILVNEDSEIDFKLLQAEFKRAHFDCQIKQVGTREEFIRALPEFLPDLIISDYYLVGFNGLDALEIVKRLQPDIPFIILTNALNEETAVECMKRGATDYVLKNRLPRVVAILQGAINHRRLVLENIRIQREHEQLFRLTPDLFCMTSLDGVLQVVNPAWPLRLGYPLNELVGRPLFTLVHPDDRHALSSWWSSLVSSGQTAAPFATVHSTAPTDFECRLVHKEKGFRNIQWSAKPFVGENKIYAYGHDLTEHKQAELALRESEARFRRMADSAPVLIWMSEPSKAFSYFNQPWLEFTGHHLAEETGIGWTTSIHPEDREHTLLRYEQSFTERTPFRSEFRLLRADGTYRWVVTHGTPRQDEQGNFSGYIGSCFDVTDQHEVEAHLAYRAIKQSALASFGRFALAHHTLAELNQEATRLVADTLRIEHSQVLAVEPGTFTLRLAASTGPALDEPAAPYGSASSAAILENHPIHFSDTPDDFPGAEAFSSFGVRSGVALPVGAGKHLYGFLTALTRDDRIFSREAVDFIHGLANILSTVRQREVAEHALIESEQKLLQSQKMEAVGLLAGGVAHDFNNLLTAIRCYGDILHDDLAEIAPELRSKAGEILKATARASALVRQLLAFSRKQVLQLEFLDLNAVVTELRDLIRSLLSENIELHVELHEKPVTVEADRSQIEQVIINLAINARDAMPQGGSLTVRTAWQELAPGADPELRPGMYASVTVVDTGAGMSEEVQAHLFQPFFTTKPKGRGTGLGLATCAVVLKHYEGAIRFVTAVGKGTTFNVLVPAAEAPPLNLDFSFPDEPGTGTETILLVEDDEAIRNVTGAILRTLGYQIFPFPGGAEALEFCSSPSSPTFDLLLSDIVMPNIGGRELAERLVALRPGVRVLFMSGYVDDPIILQAVQEAAVPFLEKPFTRDTLAKKVRDSLDAPRT